MKTTGGTVKTRIPIRSFKVLPPEEINIIFVNESSLADHHPPDKPRAQTKAAVAAVATHFIRN